VRTAVLTVEEIRQREECLAAGRPWPPAQEHIAALGTVDRLEKENQELRDQVEREQRSRKLTPADRHRTLDEICRKYGIEPAEELIKATLEMNSDGTPKLSNDQRIKIWTELLQYRMPKLKSIEVQGTVDHTLTVYVKKFGDIQEGQVRTFDLNPKQIGNG
jgi:hypothetical protein